MKKAAHVNGIGEVIGGRKVIGTSLLTTTVGYLCTAHKWNEIYALGLTVRLQRFCTYSTVCILPISIVGSGKFYPWLRSEFEVRAMRSFCAEFVMGIGTVVELTNTGSDRSRALL